MKRSKFNKYLRAFKTKKLVKKARRYLEERESDKSMVADPAALGARQRRVLGAETRKARDEALADLYARTLICMNDGKRLAQARAESGTASNSAKTTDYHRVVRFLLRQHSLNQDQRNDRRQKVSQLVRAIIHFERNDMTPRDVFAIAGKISLRALASQKSVGSQRPHVVGLPKLGIQARSGGEVLLRARKVGDGHRFEVLDWAAPTHLSDDWGRLKDRKSS